jgi:hypothetical protein
VNCQALLLPPALRRPFAPLRGLDDDFLFISSLVSFLYEYSDPFDPIWMSVGSGQPHSCSPGLSATGGGGAAGRF